VGNRPVARIVDAGGGSGIPNALHNRLYARVPSAAVANHCRHRNERSEAVFLHLSRRSKVGASRAARLRDLSKASHDLADCSDWSSRGR